MRAGRGTRVGVRLAVGKGLTEKAVQGPLRLSVDAATKEQGLGQRAQRDLGFRFPPLSLPACCWVIPSALTSGKAPVAICSFRAQGECCVTECQRGPFGIPHSLSTS